MTNHDLRIEPSFQNSAAVYKKYRSFIEPITSLLILTALISCAYTVLHGTSKPSHEANLNHYDTDDRSEYNFDAYSWNVIPPSLVKIHYQQNIKLKSNKKEYSVYMQLINNSDYIVEAINVNIETFACNKGAQENICALIEKRNINHHVNDGLPGNSMYQNFFIDIKSMKPADFYKNIVTIKKVAVGDYINPENRVAGGLNLDDPDNWQNIDPMPTCGGGHVPSEAERQTMLATKGDMKNPVHTRC